LGAFLVRHAHAVEDFKVWGEYPRPNMLMNTYRFKPILYSLPIGEYSLLFWHTIFRIFTSGYTFWTVTSTFSRIYPDGYTRVRPRVRTRLEYLFK
jgi:hypothetical protein